MFVPKVVDSHLFAMKNTVDDKEVTRKPHSLPGCCWFLIKVVGVHDVGVKMQNCFHYHCHHLS